MPKRLDPDVKLQIEQAWNEWTTTCTSEVDKTDPLEDIKLMIEKVRAEKLDQMQRAYEAVLWREIERARWLAPCRGMVRKKRQTSNRRPEAGGEGDEPQIRYRRRS